MARIVREPPAKLALLKALKQPVYDTEVQDQAAGATARLTFFTRPEGQADAAGVAKTRFETNLATSGQLPKPKFMDLYGFRVRIFNRGAAAPVAWADYYAMLFRARFEFRVGDVTVLEIPLDEIPQGVGFSGFNALDASPAPLDRTEMSRGVPSVYEVFDITVRRLPQRISHGEQIQALIEWHGGAPVLTAAVSIAVRVSLIGVLYPEIG